MRATKLKELALRKGFWHGVRFTIVVISTIAGLVGMTFGAYQSHSELKKADDQLAALEQEEIDYHHQQAARLATRLQAQQGATVANGNLIYNNTTAPSSMNGYFISGTSTGRIFMQGGTVVSGSVTLGSPAFIYSIPDGKGGQKQVDEEEFHDVAAVLEEIEKNDAEAAKQSTRHRL